MKRNRIGFYKGEDNAHEDKIVKDAKFHLMEFIDSNYYTTGSTEQKQFKTSLEIIYMLRETIEVTIKDVNAIMDELGFQMIFIDQISNWVLYSKDTLDDE